MVDTTVKSGGDTPFSPHWYMVQGHKSGHYSDDEYTKLYMDLMRQRYSDNPDYWHAFVRQHRVAVGCYCPAGAFCHRHLLLNCLEGVAKQQGVPFVRRGELG